MTQNKELIREYKAGDELNINKMHNELFNTNRSLDHWNWQFRDHTQGHGWITLAVVENEIVGHYCMMRNHLNFMGREIVAGQTCGSMIRSDQRGKKLSTKLIRHNSKYAAKEGAVAVFGFPNRDAYPGIMRNSERLRLATLKYYLYRIGFQKIWASKIDRVFKYFHGMLIRMKYIGFRFLNKDVVIVVSSHLPDRLEDSLREIREYEVLSIWKDVSYLRWRYENHPDRKYTFHILNVKGRPEGLIVTLDCGEIIAICDLLHRTKNVSQSALLLLHVLNYYNASDAQKIEFYGYDNGFFDAVFGTCGFNIVPFSNFVFTGRVFEDMKPEKMFIIPQNWTIAYGDTDII
jgi:GNAT superfamily N-acetyltransferase